MGVPVGETIARAWKFSGRRAVPLLGLGWLTATFYGAAIAYFLGKLSATMLVWPRPDAGSFNNFALFYVFCLVMLTALANAVLGAAMTREAMEPGAEWKTAFISITRREWGLFANLLLLYVVVIGLVAAVVFAGEVGAAVALPMIGNGGVWKGIALVPVMHTTFVVIAIAAGLFLATRFGFFLAPIAVSDPPARLLQAWISSRGNFWRLLVLSLGLLAPVVVVALLVDWMMLGSQFSDAVIALFGVSHDNAPLFQMVRANSGVIAAVLAVALLVWNAIFAGSSAEAYARAEHGEKPHTSFVPQAEPAFAMASVSPHMAMAEMRRAEPGFAAEEIKPVAKAPDVKSDDVRSEETNPAAVAANPMAEPAVEHEAEEKEAEKSHSRPEEIEFKTVGDLPAPSIAGPGVATTEAEPAGVEMHEEPLAPQEPLPAMDPMGHAAPAAPDPSGVPPATPLPSFVRPQSSPKDGSSEAA